MSSVGVHSFFVEGGIGVRPVLKNPTIYGFWLSGVFVGGVDGGGGSGNDGGVGTTGVGIFIGTGKSVLSLGGCLCLATSS